MLKQQQQFYHRDRRLQRRVLNTLLSSSISALFQRSHSFRAHSVASISNQRVCQTQSKHGINNSRITHSPTATRIVPISLGRPTFARFLPAPSFRFFTSAGSSSSSSSVPAGSANLERAPQTNDEAPSTEHFFKPGQPAPHKFWLDIANQRRFLEWAAKQLNVQTLDDWYKITKGDIVKLGGYGLVLQYNSSLVNCLMALYPDHPWIPWQFRGGAPHRFWDDPANQRWFFEWASKKLGVEKLDDWYQFSSRDLTKLGGAGLLNSRFNGSLLQALKEMYPAHEWLPWRFKNVPQGFWTSKANQRMFFDWAAKQLGVTKLDDWYNVTVHQVRQLGGSALLINYYETSHIKALMTVYPEHEWLPWRFKTVPMGFWDDKANHKRFFDWAGKQLGVEQLDDWYKFSFNDICKLGGIHLLKTRYGSSYNRAVMSLYPNHEWLPWKFQVAQQGFWKDPANHKKFLDWIAKQLNIKSFDDWYNFTTDDIAKLNGHRLLHLYGNSLFKALSAAYPEHKWLPWRFKSVANGFWSSVANQRDFFDWAGKQLGIKQLDDWYSIPAEAVKDLGGSTILYGVSLPQALANVYPEHSWDTWRFHGARMGEIADTEALRRYVAFLASKLNVKHLDDWYRVSLLDIRKLAGYVNMAERHGGLFAILKRLHPDHPWDEDKMLRSTRWKRATQRQMLSAAKELFPDEEVFEDFVHPELRFEVSGNSMTFDVWIPSISLALEYQGEQHYHDIYAIASDTSRQQQRDQDKLQRCQSAGITLISVPYWWNKSTEDLAATILQAARPELLSLLATNETFSRAASAGTAIAACSAPPPPPQPRVRKGSSNEEKP